MTDTATLDGVVNTVRERLGWFEKYADDLYAGFDTAPPATRAEITDLFKYTAGEMLSGKTRWEVIQLHRP